MQPPQWWDPHRRCLGLFLAGDAIRSRHRDGTRVLDDSFLLWLNAEADHLPVVLPDHAEWAERYEVLVDTGDPSREGIVCAAGATLVLAPRAAVLLRAR
jgi:glycogen operon protein